MSVRPWEDYVEVRDIIALHREGLEKYGGQDGLKEGEECLEGAVGNAWNSSLYVENGDERPKLAFIAYILRNIAMAHCFIDGNKRAAWATAMHILAASRLTLSASEDEAYAFMIRLIENHLDPEDVLDWVALRLEWIH